MSSARGRVARSSSPSSCHKPAFLERWQLPMPAELVGDGAADVPSMEDAGVAAEGVGVDPDHHLWRNGRLWWVAISVLEHGWHQERVRVSLQTADLALARRRRDAWIARVAALEGCRLSLRFDGHAKRRRRGAGRVRERSGADAGHRASRRSARRRASASGEVRVAHERRWQSVRTSVAAADARPALQGGSER